MGVENDQHRGVIDFDNFDASNPFTKGVAVDEDEVKLKFDDGRSLYVSKWFLSATSPVFERMFKSGFKESNDYSISMSGKECDPFLNMLLNLHPRIQKELPGNRFFVFYPHASRVSYCYITSSYIIVLYFMTNI